MEHNRLRQRRQIQINMIRIQAARKSTSPLRLQWIARLSVGDFLETPLTLLF
jgi:hypothetical protein